VSHELRTPLNAMLGWASMLRAGVSVDMFNRAIASIERNARSQAQLVEDLLDVSRVIAGKMKLSAVPVDLRGVVRQAVDVVRPAAQAKAIDLDVVLSDSPCWVSGDSERLQQIFWNLLSNAVKFTPKHGQVSLRCAAEGSRVVVAVQDTGQGIPAEFIPYVFEPFRQMDQTSTRSHGGLGLGLAIGRNLVELHGGTIDVVSGGADRGATFTVRLPVLGVFHESTPTADVGHNAHSSKPAPSLDDIKVVVVDDQADTLELVSTVLVGLGAHVRSCDNARDALETVRVWRPDVLISDIAMPQEDGYSLIKKVRALDPSEGRDTQAIALTAHAHIDDRVRALGAGFQMHVPKPVEPTELATIVAGLAGRDVG